MAAVMSREEFEVWLDDHKDDAVDRIEASNLRVDRWIALLAVSLGHLSSEADEEEEEDVGEIDTELSRQPEAFNASDGED